MAHKSEDELRHELSDAYHLAAQHGWTDSIFTHFSVRLPQEEAFLINGFGLNFEEITPHNLVKVSLDGKVLAPKGGRINLAGYTIHSAVHEARPEIVCVMHTHTNTAMALSMLECGLLTLSQHSCRFHKRLAYHDYEGIAFDLDEKPRLIRDLGKHQAMILRNHGFLVLGRTVGEAFVILYNLEKSAQAQLTAMATGQKLIAIPDEVADYAATQFGDAHLASDELAWEAFRRTLG